uniref:Protein SDA1 n=1 Tax=Theileria annulata TaxID=5874 RepID=A0A3B0NDD0_THEAN
MLELDILQNNIKKDPEANFDNFYNKYNEFISLFEIVKLSPQIYNSDFIKLLDFIINTISYYNGPNSIHNNIFNSTTINGTKANGTTGNTIGTIGNTIGTIDNTAGPTANTNLNNNLNELCINLINYVKKNKKLINEKMRKLIINSTFILRTKRQINLQTIIIEWLELLDLNDKQQRKKLFNFILKDLILLSKNKSNKLDKINKLVKSEKSEKSNKSVESEKSSKLDNSSKSTNSSKSSKSTKLENSIKEVEIILFNNIKNSNTIISLLSCSIILEMYRRRIWNNIYILNSLVNIITSPKQQNIKLLLLLTHFLLSTKNYYGILFDEEEMNINEMTNNIILDLNEPYELITNLLQKINLMKYNNKIIILKLVATIINKFKIIYPNFYEIINKYINHKQPEITKILLILIISIHEHITTVMLKPIINNLLMNFISHDRDENVIIIGITTVINRLDNIIVRVLVI